MHGRVHFWKDCPSKPRSKGKRDMSAEMLLAALEDASKMISTKSEEAKIFQLKRIPT